MERQPETIETTWQELRAVLQDQIQSPVTVIGAADGETVKEVLGDVIYTVCAARDDDEGKSDEIAALSMGTR